MMNEQPHPTPASAAAPSHASRPFEIIPAIDIRGGRCVRLYQGDYEKETVYGDDPLAIAYRWQEQGGHRLHVVDLDAARSGVPANFDWIVRIARALRIPVQAGGGIRDEATARRYLDAGVARVVLGTAAVRDPGLVERLTAADADRVIVALDARDGIVRTAGWTEASELTVAELATRMLALGVRRFLYTDIGVDGTLTEPNYAAYRSLASTIDAAIIASGGVARVEQIPRLAACGVAGAIIGKALYTGAFDLRAAGDLIAR
jgi:phosphoribosylformimino-5-aminoimidazole carboxamide ribotide isomerase